LSRLLWQYLFKHGYYTATIVQAGNFVYSDDSLILTQQIPEFNTSISFEGGTIYSAGPGGSYQTVYLTTLHNLTWYNVYDMVEDPYENNNVDSSYVMQLGTYDTNVYGYSQETWNNSWDILYPT
jgi:hypothetical protein